MFRSLFRILAVALALMVPLQGMASVATGMCMTFGHHQGADDHVHGDDAQDEHDQHSHSHGDEGKGSHCGPCAACCASASIAGPVSIWLPAALSTEKYAFFQSSPPSVQLDGLDRPPLSL